MLVARELLGELCDELRRSGKKIIFTNGCFDILHVGHTRYLAESKRLGDILIVGLNSDSSVKRLKGDSRPVNSEPDRAEVLSALESVDFVSIFDEDTPYELIKCLIPDVITKGGDYNPDDVVGADIVRANGGEVIIINFVEGKSTTSVINKMKS
ncbi:D-glycero-beta-D-manno-heptose 1-phosphate adenylyltransferase [Candidatus Kapaibacterium sp.]